MGVIIIIIIIPGTLYDTLLVNRNNVGKLSIDFLSGGSPCVTIISTNNRHAQSTISAQKYNYSERRFVNCDSLLYNNKYNIAPCIIIIPKMPACLEHVDLHGVIKYVSLLINMVILLCILLIIATRSCIYFRY